MFLFFTRQIKDKGLPKKGDIRSFKDPRLVTKDIEEPEQTIEKTPPGSDTTVSTPEMFKSPEIIQDKVPGFISENHPEMEPTIVQKTVAPRKYKGWVYIDEKILETEVQEKSSDSEDNIPVASLLKAKDGASLSIDQMEDFK